MLRHTVVDGESVKIGSVITTKELTAKMLIGMKKAEAFSPPPKKAKRKSRSHDV